MNFWDKILKPLKGEIGTVLTLVLAAVPFAFINMPMWTLALACVVVGALYFFLPVALDPIADVAYLVALVELILAPFEWFNIVFFILFVYRVLCFIAKRKTADDDEYDDEDDDEEYDDDEYEEDEDEEEEDDEEDDEEDEE